MYGRSSIKLFAVIAILVIAFGIVGAQGTISYGVGTTGEITSTFTNIDFNFQGTQGERVEAIVVGLTPGLSPGLVLKQGSNQLISSAVNPQMPDANSATVAFRLPQTGGYTLSVTGASDRPGRFAVYIQSTGVPVFYDIFANQPLIFNVGQSAGIQVIRFQGNPNSPTVLNIDAMPETPSYNIQVYNEFGDTIASFANAVEDGWVQIDAGNGSYEISLSSSDPATGTIIIGISNP